jgi:dGTPase
MMNYLNIFTANAEYSFKCHSEKNHAIRTDFERDRDRIIYSKEFRRLNRKTQVFISGFDDHVRNRLTHTIEVAQISKTIAKHLCANETLAEAIALGHDVGHTPFGHVGERTLNYFMNGCGNYRDFIKIEDKYKGFKHNWQGIRVVTDLESISRDFKGLNLTDYTLWGILHHTGTDPKSCEFINDENFCQFQHKNKKCSIVDDGLSFSFYNKYKTVYKTYTSWTIEGLIVRIADEIAQRHHDIEDGLYAGIIGRKEIINQIDSCFSEFFSTEEKNKLKMIDKEPRLNIFITNISSLIINFLATNIINNTKENLLALKDNFDLKKSKDFNNAKKSIYLKNGINEIVVYPKEIATKEEILQDFLKNRILNSHIAQSMDGKSTYIIRNIIKAYLDNPQQLPDGTIYNLYMRLLPYSSKNKLKANPYKHNIGILRDKLKSDHTKNNSLKYRNILLRTICDFIAGMTDDFALKQYNVLYGTTNVFNNI